MRLTRQLMLSGRVEGFCNIDLNNTKYIDKIYKDIFMMCLPEYSL